MVPHFPATASPSIAGYTLHKLTQYLIHSFFISKFLLQSKHNIAKIRAARFQTLDISILSFATNLEVPALGNETDSLVFGQFDKCKCFFAFLVFAFYVEVEVHPLKCLAEYRLDIVDCGSAAVGALVVGLLGGPGGDAAFAEEFTAVVALVGVEYNLYADGALEGFVSGTNEPVWVVAALVHFVVLLTIKYYNLKE